MSPLDFFRSRTRVAFLKHAPQDVRPMGTGRSVSDALQRAKAAISARIPTDADMEAVAAIDRTVSAFGPDN